MQKNNRNNQREVKKLTLFACVEFHVVLTNAQDLDVSSVKGLQRTVRKRWSHGTITQPHVPMRTMPLSLWHLFSTKQMDTSAAAVH